MATLFPDNSSTSMSNSAIDDGSSPYLLHHSDSPGLLLVSQLLTGNNYASWRCAMLIALSIKNKPRFVNGLISRPSGNFDLKNSKLGTSKKSLKDYSRTTADLRILVIILMTSEVIGGDENKISGVEVESVMVHDISPELPN
ncbi:uncharacterized protein LOC127795805 [Diospyros lotus]|uniref:uncharacterized protein LOC127795805 n=1 Tax=Diospyros lotus TaxID=55363 RepID=UPI002255C2BE|nr:uncharacterized protein LOC127795805 [Diospyros lotus]